MREEIVNLISTTIVHKYDLPYGELGIPNILHSNSADKCFQSQNDTDLAEVIYNAIVEYAFDEFEMGEYNLDVLHARALQSRIKFNKDADPASQLKYGFFGEIILFAVLYVMFDARPVISRGHFYNPLENSETKGYDSYHLIEIGDRTQLWCGEVKFHGRYKSGIDDVFKKIENALSNEYLEKNFIAISNHSSNRNLAGSRLKPIIDAWLENPNIVITDEITNRGIELVYPVLLLYDQSNAGYDTNVNDIVEYIHTEYPELTFNLRVLFTVFFILVPVTTALEIKKQVLEWIVTKKSLRP